MSQQHPSPTPRAPLARREFLAGAAAATITVLGPSLVRGTEANSTIALGLIGCGGRGNWLTNLFDKTGHYRFVALADYFQDRVDTVGDRLKVDPAHRHTTLSGYKRLLDEKLDAVVIETPPFCHPEHAAAAVEAGKHVYVAKPIAVDVPGCASIEESGKRATARKLVFLVDFQTRAHPFYREAARRIHAGALGKISCAETHYPWAGGGKGSPVSGPEDRLRKWYQELVLCGDVIVEQDIHALDVVTWFLDAAPERAVGTGGRPLREYGNFWDNFSVIYTFPGDVTSTHTSMKAIAGCRDEIRCRVFGGGGMVHSDYFGDVWIRGTQPFEGGSVGQLYTDGALMNIESFYRFITEGHYANETVAPSVRSNLTAILGRTAAYKHGPVTWDEMIQANEKLDPDLRGLKA
jgi:myo-inositol 2-dehydrogenase/D-chiro-inositol 1-dehydrogenase